MAEYIEREALKEHLLSYAGMFTDELGFVVSLQAVLNGIDFQPAADVAEVKHGEWVFDIYTKRRRCSECETYKPYDVVADRIDYWDCDYCPNCGAKMEG